MRCSLLIPLAFLLLTADCQAGLNFSGYIQAGKESKFVLTDSDVSRSSGWLKLGQSFEDYELIAFDPKEEVLSIQKGATIIKLPLKVSRVEDAAIGLAEPSGAFRLFVASQKIAGADPSGRIMVVLANGTRVFRIGDILDSMLGVKLHSVNVESGVTSVIFEDKTGAQVSRKL